MPKKRVLIVGLFLDPQNGIPTQAYELANVLEKNGYTVLRVSKFRNKTLRLLHTILFILFNRSKYDVGIVQVYSGLSLVWELISSSLIKMSKKKVIMTIHGGGVPDRIRRKPKIHLDLFKKANAITCPSDFIINALREFNIDSVLIENSIRIQNYEFLNKKNIQPVIFWMRSLEYVYNPEMAVMVINELKNTYNYRNVKLYIGGPDTGSKGLVLELIKKYDLKHNIELVGFVNMKGKIYFANQCDVYICTNRIDNAPVSFIEMMAFGLPIVTTNVGGILHLVTDNETALVVADEDYKAMAQRIDYLITHPDIAGKLTKNGRRFAQKFSEEAVFMKWDKLLDSI
jgi:glycosyltransferase involved in cell wall biosynthesis